MSYFQISPTLAQPESQVLGGVVYISTEIRTAAGVLGTPGTSINIQIIGPDGTVVVAYTAMTADSTGKYSYSWATATTNLPGSYVVWIRTVDGGNTSITSSKDGLFRLRGL